jgi:hypothetical protein
MRRHDPASDVVTWFESAPLDAAKTVLEIVRSIVNKRASEADGRPVRRAKVNPQPASNGKETGS